MQYDPKWLISEHSNGVYLEVGPQRLGSEDQGECYFLSLWVPLLGSPESPTGIVYGTWTPFSFLTISELIDVPNIDR